MCLQDKVKQHRPKQPQRVNCFFLKGVFRCFRWMKEWMSGLMYRETFTWTSAWMDEWWMRGWKFAGMNGWWGNEWMRIDGWILEWMDGYFGGWWDGGMNGRLEELVKVNKLLFGWKDERQIGRLLMDKKIIEQFDEWKEGWMDGIIFGWMVNFWLVGW